MKYAILVGLNRIDPKYYGTNGQLQGCINDTISWSTLIKADEEEFLLNEQATPENFLGVLQTFKSKLKAGDTLFILYSGHGTQVSSSHQTEKDKLDEAFCFYNRIFLDKNFNNNLASIKEGVKVVGIFDCCFSGGISRTANMFRKKALNTSLNNRRVFKLSPLKCSYISVCASLESQPAMDGDKNGLFTQTMVNTYKGQPVIKWLKEASALVKVQKINYKTSGAKFDWSTFVL